MQKQAVGDNENPLKHLKLVFLFLVIFIIVSIRFQLFLFSLKGDDITGSESGNELWKGYQKLRTWKSNRLKVLCHMPGFAKCTYSVLV